MAEQKKSSPESDNTAEKPGVANVPAEGKKDVQPQQAVPEQKASIEQNRASTGGEDAIALLIKDHRLVEKLFQQYKEASRRAEKLKLAQQICRELIIHTMLEEEIFYPACREHIDDEMLDEAQVEHDGAKILINEVLSGSPGGPFYDAEVSVLSEVIRHHVNEEEKRNEGIFAKAKAGGVDVDEIARRLEARKAELVARAEERGLERPRLRSFVNATEMERNMPREQYRERDDRGRFSDDDDRRYASRPSRTGSRDYDDDRRYNDRESQRDERGRFTSDDDRRYMSRSSREDDNRHNRGQERDEYGRFVSEADDRRSGSRSRRGWFGDPEGHSEASKRGREERSGGTRSYDEDDRRSSGRYQERERDEYGRFVSDDDDDRRSGGRSRRGWFGDPEGHSEASKRGWDERSGGARSYDDDERRSSGRYQERDERGRFMSEEDEDRRYADRPRGRSRDEDERDYGRGEDRHRDERGRFASDDEDRRSGRGSHGGWFGDSEGHSEASKRGWDERRSEGDYRRSSRSGR
jgi:hypothetical protein